MNVLSIIHYPVFGGPHNRTTIVARLLEPYGIKTTVVLPEGGEAAAARMNALGVDTQIMPLHRLRAIPNPRLQLAWLAAMRREIRAITELIRERDIDVVAVNALANPHGGIAARRAGVACVWELIDTYPPAALCRAYMPLVVRLSDVIMTTGRKVAEMHPGTLSLGDRWVSFYPCVDVEQFTADPVKKAAARDELGLPQDATVIGNVATLNPMKGHHTFVRAAAQLRRSVPDVRFVLLGSEHADRDAYYRSLWGEAESLGLRLGHELIVRDPGARVAELAQAFDLFWMTSEPRSEGIPTAIGEAKALGLPVVTTDVGSTSECVTDGVSGFVVPPRDPEAIAAATLHIINHPRRYDSMRLAAREEAVREFAAAEGAEQHRIAYERALEHRATFARHRRRFSRRG